MKKILIAVMLLTPLTAMAQPMAKQIFMNKELSSFLCHQTAKQDLPAKYTIKEYVSYYNGCMESNGY